MSTGAVGASSVGQRDSLDVSMFNLVATHIVNSCPLGNCLGWKLLLGGQKLIQLVLFVKTYGCVHLRYPLIRFYSVMFHTYKWSYNLSSNW